MKITLSALLPQRASANRFQSRCGSPKRIKRLESWMLDLIWKENVLSCIDRVAISCYYMEAKGKQKKDMKTRKKTGLAR